jgi:hypothetical protein
MVCQVPRGFLCHKVLKNIFNNLIIFSFIILLWQVELVEQAEAEELVNLVEQVEVKKAEHCLMLFVLKAEQVEVEEQAEVVACGVEVS